MRFAVSAMNAGENLTDQKTRGLRGWLDRRYQLTPLFEFLGHKQVPLGSHWMGWYYLGGITMFFFIVQVVTGVLLLMYYQPGEATVGAQFAPSRI